MLQMICEMMLMTYMYILSEYKRMPFYLQWKQKYHDNSNKNWKYLNNASEAKVGNLDNVVVTDENVSCSQVTVDVVLRLKVRHSAGYLRCNVYQLRKLQRSTSPCWRHHVPLIQVCHLHKSVDYHYSLNMIQPHRRRRNCKLLEWVFKQLLLDIWIIGLYSQNNTHTHTHHSHQY